MASAKTLAFGFLMMKYGNGGACCSADNHEYMKALYEERDEDASLLTHRITNDCKEACGRIEEGDYSELSVYQRKKVKDFLHWSEVVGNDEQETKVNK